MLLQINILGLVDGVSFPQLKTAHHLLEIMAKLSIHPVVNDWIDHAVRHGQPIEPEKQMRYIAGRSNRRIVVCIHVEHVIR